MKTVVVSGANGFIGSALVKRLLSKGCRVIAIDVAGHTDHLPFATDRFSFISCDAIGEVSLTADVFCHLAWVGKAGPERANWRTQLDNVRMALSYYEYAIRFSCSRFVCAGTIGEKMLDLDECLRLKSQNAIYVNSKLYLHRILKIIEKIQCPVVWATLGNMYGNGAAGGSILDYALRLILKGEPVEFGPGDQPYDFVNVQDAIRGLEGLLLSSSIHHDEFYVGNGTPRLLKDWITDVGKLAGRPDLVKIGGRPDDGTRYKEQWFSIEALKADTGFSPEINFADGIRDNIRYLRGLL